MVNFVESFRHVYGTQIGCIASLYKLIDDITFLHPSPFLKPN